MSNLLDSASIVLTPTAYDNGRMLSVKPSVALGPELITNGDFATDSDWVKGNATIADGKVTITVVGGAFSYISQPKSYTSGKTYKVAAQIQGAIGSSGKQIRLQDNSSDIGGLKASNGEITLDESLQNIEIIWTANANSNVISVARSTNSGDYSFSIDNVSVKEDISGDFDFSRNSAATRVNAQGLVENVQILSGDLVSNGDFSQEGAEEVSNGSFSQEGAEEVTNGDFENGSANWVTQSGTINFTNNEAEFVGSAILKQEAVLTSGKTYKIVYEVSSIVGSPNFKLYDGSWFSVPSTIGTHIIYREISLTTLYLRNDSSDNITIDNVSVKEAGQDWSLGTGWSIADGKAIYDGTGGTSSMSQSNIPGIQLGKTYKVTVNILSNEGEGANTIFLGGTVLSSSHLNAGSYTFYGSFTSNTNFYIYGRSGEVFEIDNVSVKEVGQDWTLGSGWSIGTNEANAEAGSGSKIIQTNTLNGKKCKVTLTVSNYGGSGLILVDFGSVSSPYITSNGTHTVFGTYDANNFEIFKNPDFVGSITNISVIEITDDTNLPRINYEGFSYQDSLGSELVFNGDFATDLSNWTGASGRGDYTWDNGKAKITNDEASSYPNLYQNPTTVAGQVYKVTATVEIGTASTIEVRVYDSATLGSQQLTTDGQIEFYFTAVGTSPSLHLYLWETGNTGNYCFFDNVSVKEVLGQEVVPDSGCGSWLLEPQSTNLVPYSEDFSNADWNKNNSSITSNAAISPDGSLNADKHIPSATPSVNKYIFTNNNTATSGIDYSLTLFAKKGEYDKLRIEDGNNSKGAWFDLSNGTLGTVGSSVVAKIENYGNGWYRCSVIKPSITGNIFFVIYSSNIESVQVGDGTSGIYIWGAMLEQQSYATSYIPTNGAASTRLQDIANNSGNATLINSTEGVLYAEVATLVDPTSVMIIGLSDGTVANRLSITFHSTLNRIQIFAQKNSFQLFNIDNTSVSKTNFNKIAISYNSTSAKFFLNGTLVASAIPSDMFTANTLDRLNFDIGSGSNKFHGKTKALVVYKEALTDEQLICLTTI